jgi:hypothetical protein
MAIADSDSVPPAPAPPRVARRHYWQGLIEECHQSGLSQAEFCRQRGVKRRSLSFWKWKLSHAAGAPGPAASRRGRPPRARAFVPVQVVPPRRPSGAVSTDAVPAWAGEIELVLPPGRLVRVRGRVDAGWLRQVLGIVEAPRC